MIIKRYIKPYQAARTSFDQVRTEMDRLFGGLFAERMIPRTKMVYPPVNLYDDDENFYLTAELPGMNSDNLDINVEAENIQIKGEQKVEPEEKNGHYHRRERKGGGFAKKIFLPARISTDKVKADMKNGILKVTMAKAQEIKSKKIQVKNV